MASGLTISLTPTEDSRQAFEHRFKGLKDDIVALGPMLARVGVDSAHAVMERIFEGEGFDPTIGMPAWAPLAPRTQKEREELGFGAQHPILVRTGELKGAMIEEGHPYHIVEQSGGGTGDFKAKVGTEDIRFEWMQTGEIPGREHIPARPIWPQGAPEKKFCADLEESLIRLVGMRLATG